MKKLILLLTGFAITGCATSVEELKKAHHCNVWQEQKILGPFNIEVRKSKAEWKGRCSILGLFFCQWVESEIHGNIIYQESNGLFNSKSKIATFENNRLTYNQSFFDKVAKTEPIVINPKMREVKVTSSLDLFNLGQKATRTIHFNNSCSNKQVALGVATLITAKNR